MEFMNHAHMGLGTVFHAYGDSGNPDSRLACTGRDLVDSDRIVAHPTLPCGSRVFLYNPRTQKATIAKVQDRGPRHAMVDLSIGTAKALDHNGKELVVMIPIGEK